MAEMPMQFAGGEHVPVPVAPDVLNERALEWLANGRLHLDDAERLLEAGDRDAAEKQLRLLVGSVNTVLLQIIEARQ